MATFEFTYKVPDEPMVNSWDDGNTETHTYVGDATANLFFDDLGLLVGSTFTGHDSTSDFPELSGDWGETISKVTVDVNDGIKEKLAVAIAKMQSGSELDPAESKTLTYTDTAVPGVAGQTYPKPDNFEPQMVWTPVWNNDALDLEMKAQQKNTMRELEARRRKHEVNYFHTRYDLGTEGESDATAFMTAINSYIASVDDLNPWMLTNHADITDISDVPKIPASVRTAIGSLTENNIHTGFVNWDMTPEAEEELTAPRVFYSEVE